MGYKNVCSYTEGIPAWRQLNFPMNIDAGMMNIKVHFIKPEKLYSIMKKKDILIVDIGDVRPEANRQRVYISGAVRYPLSELHEKYKELPKDIPLVITDVYMKRAPVAAKFLMANGLNVTGVLRGGVEAWLRAELPVAE
jgi:rhodanese-related sulfurtransferase